jgi:hypothetical protein
MRPEGYAYRHNRKRHSGYIPTYRLERIGDNDAK